MLECYSGGQAELRRTSWLTPRLYYAAPSGLVWWGAESGMTISTWVKAASCSKCANLFVRVILFLSLIET